MIFTPKPEAATAVTTSTSSSNTDLASHEGCTAVRLSNTSGTAAEFVRVNLGSDVQTADVDNMVLLAGESIVLPMPLVDPNLGLESASGAPVVIVQPGYFYGG